MVKSIWQFAVENCLGDFILCSSKHVQKAIRTMIAKLSQVTQTLSGRLRCVNCLLALLQFP